MVSFREFDAGPDPFGRKFHVLFKWFQPAISIRHSDTMDVKFILIDENGGQTEKTIALPHLFLLETSRGAGRTMDDSWCARLAARHLLHLVESGEDMEKDLVTVTLPDLKRYAEDAGRGERTATSSPSARR